MWFKKKKVEESKKEIPTISTRDAVMEVLIINNRTEKEYVYKSENDFGLDWETIDNWLHIKQVTSLKGEWKAIAALVDFSIVKCEWKTFDIV